MRPSRSLRPLGAALALFAGSFLAHAPIAAQQPVTPTMHHAVDALLRALQARDFQLLEPHLDDGFRAQNLPGPVARQLLRRVVESGARIPSAIEVRAAAPEGDNVRLAAEFAYESGGKDVGLLLTPAGKFVEVPLFQVHLMPGMTAADAAATLGPEVRVQMGSPPPGGAVRVPASPAPPPASVPANPALRAELLQMMERDQRHRRESPNAGPPDSAAILRMAEDDRANMQRLEEMIAAHGWPGRSLVGQDGATAAFLVLQHSELPVQEQYLPMLREAAAAGELPASMLAMLEDRVRVRRGEKQLYGTQVREDASGRRELYPLDDPANVDERRARVGLPPLAVYLRGMGVEQTPPR